MAGVFFQWPCHVLYTMTYNGFCILNSGNLVGNLVNCLKKPLSINLKRTPSEMFLQNVKWWTLELTFAGIYPSMLFAPSSINQVAST